MAPYHICTRTSTLSSDVIPCLCVSSMLWRCDVVSCKCKASLTSPTNRRTINHCHRHADCIVTCQWRRQLASYGSAITLPRHATLKLQNLKFCVRNVWGTVVTIVCLVWGSDHLLCEHFTVDLLQGVFVYLFFNICIYILKFLLNIVWYLT